MKIKIPIIYEDDDLLVINKPAGVAVHRDQFTLAEAVTIADWVVEKYPELAEVGEPLTLSNGTVIKKPGIVHRLDKDTSGALIIAKNQSTYEFLKQQFQDHVIKKTYLALVYGEVKFPLGRQELTIDYPIGRSRNDPRKRVARAKSVGKERAALTKIRIKERLGEYTLLEALPETGRTHQIRVHLKALHHPVVCDHLYAEGKACPIVGAESLTRQALHAAKLEFTLSSGEPVVIAAPTPADFAKTLELLRGLC